VVCSTDLAHLIRGWLFSVLSVSPWFGVASSTTSDDDEDDDEAGFARTALAAGGSGR
jgi:hypothetical protein